MTTLAADMDASQDYIANTENDADLPSGFYTLGSELVRVSSERSSGRSSRGGGQLATVGRVVTRGVAGTTAAAHSAGVTLTRVQDPSTGGGSGGVTVDNGSDPPAAVTTLVAPGAVLADGSATLPLSFQLLGPYRINFDDPDAVSDDGKALVALPDGALLIRAWPIIRTTWDGTFTDALLIVQLSDDPVTTSASVTSGYDLTDREFPEADPWAVSPEWDHTGIDYTFHDARLGVAQHGASFNVRVFIAGGSATAGAADVYAIIAVPTS